MKKLIVPFVLAVLFLSASSFLLNNPHLPSFYYLSQKDFKVEAFTSIHIGVSADVHYSVGNKHSVKVDGDPADIEDLIVEVQNGALSIRYEKNHKKRSKLDIHIVSKALDGVKISGSAHFKTEDDITSDEIDLVISGSGEAQFGKLSADEVNVKISGSGDVLIDSGSADECDAIISGSGKLAAEGFEVNEFSVKISGSGNCKITANEDLDAIVSGSGSVFYQGNPRVNSVVSGSGKVKSL